MFENTSSSVPLSHSYFPRSFFHHSFSPLLSLFTCGLTPSFSSSDVFNPLFHVSHLPPSLQFLIVKIFPVRGCVQTLNIAVQCFQHRTHTVPYSSIHPSVQPIRGLPHQSRQLSQVPPAACKQAQTEGVNLQEQVCVFKSMHTSLCTLCPLASLEWSIWVRWCFRVAVAWQVSRDGCTTSLNIGRSKEKKRRRGARTAFRNSKKKAGYEGKLSWAGRCGCHLHHCVHL